MTQAFNMGISAQQHRICIGLFCRYSPVGHSCVRDTSECHGLSRQLFYTFGVMFYFYLLIQMLFFIIDINNDVVVPSIDYRLNTNTPLLPLVSDFLINLKTLAMLVSVFLRYLEGYECEDAYDTMVVLLKLFSRCYKKVKLIIHKSSKCIFNFQSIYLLFYLLSMGLILIVILNPSIVNPGPRKLSVLYNNIQGFVNTRDLASDSPPLNITKVHEINGYIYTNKPDIILMNEAWLKRPILSNQVLPDNYNVFRADRSPKSHPYDHSRPKKFRKNGGGVLIAGQCPSRNTFCIF